jgi:flagellar protein FlaG
MDIRPLGSGVQPGTAATTTPASNTQTNPSTPAAVEPDGTNSTAATPEPSGSQVAQAVQKINASPAVQSQGIEFSIDSTSHRIVVKVVDQSTNQVIRQIPSKEALAIADSLDESPSSGLLIKQQA